MLRISKLADYTTLLLNHLAANPSKPISARDLAEKTYLQLPTVSKLLKAALHNQLVASTRGVDGGYTLSRSADSITLAQIVTAIEGSPSLTQCSTHASSCKQSNTCPLKSKWQHINDFFLTTLENISLADMQNGKPLHLPLTHTTRSHD